MSNAMEPSEAELPGVAERPGIDFSRLMSRCGPSYTDIAGT
jgi:hypothetical protein